MSSNHLRIISNNYTIVTNKNFNVPCTAPVDYLHRTIYSLIEFCSKMAAIYLCKQYLSISSNIYFANYACSNPIDFRLQFCYNIVDLAVLFNPFEHS